jgi:hypothetical protein
MTSGNGNLARNLAMHRDLALKQAQVAQSRLLLDVSSLASGPNETKKKGWFQRIKGGAGSKKEVEELQWKNGTLVELIDG